MQTLHKLCGICVEYAEVIVNIWCFIKLTNMRFTTLAAACILLFASCKKGGDSSDTTTPATLPTIDTIRVDGIGQTEALLTAIVLSDGGSTVTASGLCFGTSHNPTLANSTAPSGIIPGLTPNTQYYFRAYATNAIGTVYSKELSVKTVELTVTDIDGNVYTVINVGKSWHFWTKENMRTTRYRNGDPITTGLSDAAWANAFVGAYALYNNQAANNALYGKLYNYYAANDSRGLCPSGYHTPTRSDMIAAVFNCNLLYPAGGSMKATTLWNSPNTGATNVSGFSAVGNGIRAGSNGSFFGLGEFGNIWSSTPYNASTGFALAFMSIGADGVIQEPAVDDGHACRCMRNE